MKAEINPSDLIQQSEAGNLRRELCIPGVVCTFLNAELQTIHAQSYLETESSALRNSDALPWNLTCVTACTHS